MTTLRCKRSLLKSSIIYLCLSIAGFAFFAYQYISAVFSWQTSMWSFFALIMTILLALFVLLFVYSINAWRTYRLEFHETFLEIQYPRLTLARPFKCAYEDIVSVWKPQTNVIQIVSREGKKLDIMIGLFEGGDPLIFDLLTQHIPAECFEKDLRNHYNKHDPIQRVLQLLQFAAALLGLFFILFGFSSMMALPLPWVSSWNYVAPRSVPTMILGASIQSPDSIWVTGPDADFSSDHHVVQHITGDQIKTWVLPDQVDFGKKRILVDSHQQPVVITNDELYFLKGGNWERFSFKAGDSIFLRAINNIAVIDNEYWVPDTSAEQPAMIHIQADQPTPQRMILRNPITQRPLTPNQVEIAMDGTTLLLDEDTSIIYLLQHGEIQKQLYPIAMKRATYISDFALGNGGSVYILLSSTSDSESFVEKIDPDGTQTFTKLPVLASNMVYLSLELDSRGRLWVSGYYSPNFVKVLEPVWGANARELVQYDDNNSNYQNSGGILLHTRDGRMWAGGFHLLWIDSNAATLPAPLPDWLAQIYKIATWIGIVFEGLGSLLGFMVFARISMNKPRIH